MRLTQRGLWTVTRLGGVLLCAGIAVLWLVAEAWPSSVVVASGGAAVRASLGSGGVYVSVRRREPAGAPPGIRVVMSGSVEIGISPWRFDPWPRHYGNALGLTISGTKIDIVFLPLWMPLVVAGGVTAWGWWKERRVGFGPGRCRSCGYELAGLGEGAVCPECGAKG